MYKIFYINLDKDTERRASIEKQMNDLGLEAERVPSTWGKDVMGDTAIYDEGRSVALHGHGLNAGEIGCAYSHLKIYKKIIDEQIPWTVVFEDDIALRKDFKKILENIKVGDAEFISFNYPPVGFDFVKNWLRASRAIIQQNPKKIFYTIMKFPYILGLSLFEGLRNMFSTGHAGRFYRPLYLAGAYMISLSGAKKLYELGMPIYCAADRLPNQGRIKSGLKMYGYIPLIAHQQTQVFTSNIAEKYTQTK